MDFEIVFWILFLLAPVLSRILKKRKEAQRGAQPPAPQPIPDRTDVQPGREINRPGEAQLTPFQEALRQIQEALVEANSEREEQERKPEPVKPLPTLRRVATPRTSVSTRSESMFEKADSKSAKKPPRRPVSTPSAGSFYDDEFEKLSAFDEPFHETVHAHIASSDEEPQQRKSQPVRSEWQEAYVASEILGTPRSRRPWNSRLEYFRGR